MQDFIQRFMFEDRAIRGAVVRLTDSCHEAIKHHQYPESVNQILYKAMAINCLLTSIITFSGKIIFQLQTDGQIPLVLSQCTHNYGLRALARTYHDNLEDKPLLGDGTLAITVVHEQTAEKTQGFVDFHQETLNVAIERYFDLSEQLATKFYLACDEKGVSGLLLQRMPGDEGTDIEAFNECIILANTLSEEELCTWDSETLLKKLFAEYDIRLLESDKVSFQCSCSDEKIDGILISMGKEELDSILEEHAFVEVTCDFCSKHFAFDRAAIEALLNQRG